ncbi:MAG: hypothetical protein IPH35_01375 [Rhodoferax sp.]|nr:hypothetical protein [Rhodoferax sp.]
MEPLSAFIIAGVMLAAAPATKRQEMDYAKPVSKNQHCVDNGTEYILPTISGDIAYPNTLGIIKFDKFNTGIAVNSRELLKREVSAYVRYKDGWNGSETLAPTSLAIDAANSFVELIPARLPFPRPMLSANGEIGLYWVLSDGYAEVSFELDGNVSFFSRTRAGKEDFQDNISLDSLGSDWFWSVIGPLDIVQIAA